MFSDILGINRRNIEFIQELNRREDYVLVDDKLTTKRICEQNNIPTASLIATCDSFAGISGFISSLCDAQSFALKPARGSGGNGIVIVKESSRDKWILSETETWDEDDRYEHVSNILYGAFSLDNGTDAAFAEELIRIHPDFAQFVTCGLPDVRVILHRGKPVLAMLRVPTVMSKGKANLHSGGFAVGVDLDSGVTQRGFFRNNYVSSNPENGASLEGRKIPFWDDLISVSEKLFTCFPLGYMGADFVIDADKGPLLLELNARPGLEIQNVTGCGLRKLLRGDV